MPTPPEDLVEDLRNFLRDHPKLNRILGGDNEHSDDDLKLALKNALDEINSFPPPLGNFDFNDFPSRSLLIKGGAIWALESAGIVQSRNRLQYSEGGVSVSVSDKAQSYQSWIQAFLKTYLQQIQRIKQSINLQGAFGNAGGLYS